MIKVNCFSSDVIRGMDSNKNLKDYTGSEIAVIGFFIYANDDGKRVAVIKIAEDEYVQSTASNVCLKLTVWADALGEVFFKRNLVRCKVEEDANGYLRIRVVDDGTERSKKVNKETK